MSELTITTDQSRIDVLQVHDFLANHAYWCPNIPLETVRRSMENSLCFGMLRGEKVVAFARVITDKATFAYVADLFVISAERGNGFSKQLLTAILAHPELQQLRNWTLFTQDAHTLYEQFGFVTSPRPERFMARSDFRGYPAQIVHV
jgi:predicted GNAT family N-acyltransferase